MTRSVLWVLLTVMAVAIVVALVGGGATVFYAQQADALSNMEKSVAAMEAEADQAASRLEKVDQHQLRTKLDVLQTYRRRLGTDFGWISAQRKQGLQEQIERVEDKLDRLRQPQ